MIGSGNYLTINNPNIKVQSAAVQADRFGQFVPSPVDENNIFDTTVANVQVKDMYLPNFSLRVYEGTFTKDALLVNKDSDGTELPGSCVFLKGSVKTFLSNDDSIYSFNGSQNFKYDPHNEFLHLIPAQMPFHYIHFSFTSDYFSEILPGNECWADFLRERVENREKIIGDHFAPMAIAQERALQNIFNCPLSGKLGLLMMETSIVQIILLQMHLLFNTENCTMAKAGARRELEIAQGLKEHLSKSFLDDHSLASLGREFGTNTNKLMVLFKKFFGKSIFDYISELRMDYARQLLRDEDLLVVEVARTVGYKNPNHFSTAFKRRFGYNPTEVR